MYIQPFLALAICANKSWKEKSLEPSSVGERECKHLIAVLQIYIASAPAVLHTHRAMQSLPDHLNDTHRQQVVCRPHFGNPCPS